RRRSRGGRGRAGRRRGACRRDPPSPRRRRERPRRRGDPRARARPQPARRLSPGAQPRAHVRRLAMRFLVSGVDAHEWRLLALLGTANAVNGYDLGILALALPAIQTALGIGEAEVGTMLAVIRLGMLPALALGVLADHYGRRSLLITTILG